MIIMLFNSYIFILCFLPLTMLAYFGLNRLGEYNAAKLSLVIASLIFCGYKDMTYVYILACSILMNYLACMLLGRFPDRSRLIVAVGVIANIALLGYFKYFNFLLENLNALTGGDFDYLDLVLPLGISYFTFQQISYLIEAGKGDCNDYSFLDYVLYVTFFPRLVAGPIVSHEELLPQFASGENKRLNTANVVMGLQLFAIGLFKKVIVADTFGKIVSYGYGHIPSLNSLEAILTILAYTIQIYYDFSGYSDMAVGVGYLFNIKLPINFNSPYKAKTIVDFWKRWHMTLTRFLTKYVYIPLGGNRKGTVRTYVNILIVFLVSGIWHGAGWTFIVWGLLHGIANGLCRMFSRTIEKIPSWISWFLNFLFLNLTWVVFRAESLNQAWQLLGRVTTGGFSINAELTESLLQPTLISLPAQFIPFLWVIIGYTTAALVVSFFARNSNEIVSRRQTGVWSLLWTYALFVISMLSMSGVSTFLYNNF